MWGVCILPTVCDHFWDLIQILILSRHRLRSGLSPQIRVDAAAAAAAALELKLCCVLWFVCIFSLRFGLLLLRSSLLFSSSRSLLILYRLWCTRLPTTAAAMSSIGTGVTFFLPSPLLSRNRVLFLVLYKAFILVSISLDFL